MLRFFVWILIFLPSFSFAMVCDSDDHAGNKGTLVLNLAQKEIILKLSDRSEAIFDSSTVCGLKPDDGLQGITCPFQGSQGGGFVSVSLLCYRGEDPKQNIISKGQLTLATGRGALACSVAGRAGYRLTLTNCQK